MKFDPKFDPAQLAEDAIRANLDPHVFEQVNEEDIARPTNVFEWIRGRRFLDLQPFPKQVEICTNIFSDFCPSCTDPKYLEVDENFGVSRLLITTRESLGDIQDRVQFLDHGVCGRCQGTRLEFQRRGQLPHYLDLAGVAGMRSSKSVTTGGLIATYQLSRFLALPSPSRFFRLLSGQMLHGTFVALTAGQAYDTLWQAFKDRIEGAPWFKVYHEFLDSEGQRLSRELYDIKDTFLWYGHKQLSWSFCGPDIRTIRGRTRIFTAIDERSWMDMGAEGSTARIRLNSNETHHALVKCVYGDTLVQTSAGLLRADEIVEHRDDGFEPRSIKVAAPGGSRTTSHTYYTTAEVSRSLVTRFGYEIGGSLTHRVVRIDPQTCRAEYAYLADITEGDYVAIMRGADLWPVDLVDVSDWSVDLHFNAKELPKVPTHVTSELASILGHLVTEGCIRHYETRDYVSFTQHERQPMAVFVDNMQACFGVELDADRNEQVIGSVALMSFLNHCGLDAVLSAEKMIPWAVRRSPRRVVVEFLRALFDGDGTTNTRTGISYTSASKTLIRQLQTLLLNFNIVASMSQSENSATNGSDYRLGIFGENAQRFAENIGFLSDRKQTWGSRVHTNTDVIPYARANLLNRIRRHTVKGGGYVRCQDGEIRRLGLHVCGQRADSRDLTYTNIRKLKADGWVDRLRLIDAEFAANIDDALADNFFWDRVTDVTVSTRPVELFDVSVPDGGERLPHAFFGNGLVNHNSLQTIRSASMALREQGIYDAPDGLNADISSPCSINDSLMQTLREANQDPTIYGFHYATWEMNPNIPLISLKTEQLNPQEFERDYGAVPPLGANQFISAQAPVLKCQRDTQQDLVSWSYETLTDDFGDTSCYLRVRARARDKSKPRILTVDTGFSNNSYAVALWSYDKGERIPVCDVALECAPRELGNDRVPVNFPAMYEHCIEPLCHNFHVIMAVFDRWNCVAGDTLVYTEHGIKRIDQFRQGQGIHKHHEIVATRDGTSGTSLWGGVGVRPVKRVTTVGGYTLTGTSDHKLLTVVDGRVVWKPIGDLVQGDWLALKAPNLWPKKRARISFEARPKELTCAVCGQRLRNLQRHTLKHGMRLQEYRELYNPRWTLTNPGGPRPRFPKTVGPHLATLLGYLVAEGWRGAEFGNKNLAVIEHYTECYKTVFGISPGQNVGTTRAGETFYRVLTSCVDVRLFFESLGLRNKSAEKQVPGVILRSPKHVVRAFLRAIFEGDGTITVNSGGTPSVSLASFSPRLLHEVQALLTNFGIFSSVTKRSVTATGENAVAFVREIGFVTKKHPWGSAAKATDILPSRDLFESWRNRGRPLQNGPDPDTAFWLRYKARNIRRAQWRKCARYLDEEINAGLGDLASYTWRQIKSIVPERAVPVYDITVPGTHSFIANGIVSHNSLDAIQRLRKDHKVEAIPYQVKWADFTAVRSRILESQISLPKAEMTIEEVRKSKLQFVDVVRSVPATHQLIQILTVREAGRKVVKPLNGTDDLFRCLCLAVTFITNPKYTSRFERYAGIAGRGATTVGTIRGNRTGAVTRVGTPGGRSAITGVRRGFRGKL